MSDPTRRDIARAGAAAVLSLGAASILPAAPASFDVTPYVHPELRAIVPTLVRMAGTPLTLETLAARRKAAFSLPLLAAPAWHERRIPGPAGAPEVRVYVVNAGTVGAPRGAILHLHGGGFVMGDARSGLRALQEIAQAIDCVIVSVDYRLAPETRFPGALEDNHVALTWLHRHAAELGADRTRIAVMGESAGGGHAAMLAIAARDRGEVPIVFQALTYPMLDDRTGSTMVKPPMMGAVVWTPSANRFGWTALLGVPAGSRRVAAGAVPARVDDLAGLPPAFIGVGSIDLFVDEDVDYARRLIHAGVATELHVIPSAFHGFDAIPGTSIARRYRENLVAALRLAFERAG